MQFTKKLIHLLTDITRFKRLQLQLIVTPQLIFAFEKSISGCCMNICKQLERQLVRYVCIWHCDNEASAYLSHKLLHKILLLHIIACREAHGLLALVELQSSILSQLHTKKGPLRKFTDISLPSSSPQLSVFRGLDQTACCFQVPPSVCQLQDRL